MKAFCGSLVLRTTETKARSRRMSFIVTSRLKLIRVVVGRFGEPLCGSKAQRLEVGL